MEWDFLWKAVLIVIAGIILLRIAGRKTISQMTLAETVIMIAIGTLLIQPVSGKNIWTTIVIGGVLVGTLLVMEFIQMKSDLFEKMITGKAKVVIEKGTLNEKNLKKLRLSVDQLEMKLRQQSVSKISDVQWATLEPSGQLGLELKQEAQPVTKKEFQMLATDVQLTLNQLKMNSNVPVTTIRPQVIQETNADNIFAEITDEHHKNPPPEHLQ